MCMDTIPKTVCNPSDILKDFEGVAKVLIDGRHI
jgi:hypothetical protein